MDTETKSGLEWTKTKTGFESGRFRIERRNDRRWDLFNFDTGIKLNKSRMTLEAAKSAAELCGPSNEVEVVEQPETISEQEASNEQEVVAAGTSLPTDKDFDALVAEEVSPSQPEPMPSVESRTKVPELPLEEVEAKLVDLLLKHTPPVKGSAPVTIHLQGNFGNLLREAGIRDQVTEEMIQRTVLNLLAWKNGSEIQTDAGLKRLATESGLEAESLSKVAVKSALDWARGRMKAGFREHNANPKKKFRIVVEGDPEFPDNGSTGNGVNGDGNENGTQGDSILEVNEDAARAMLAACGWDEPKAKVKAVNAKLNDEAFLLSLSEPVDEAHQNLYKSILHARSEGETVMATATKATGVNRISKTLKKMDKAAARKNVNKANGNGGGTAIATATVTKQKVEKEVDRFNCRVGSQAATINALIGKAPKTVGELAKETGLSGGRVSGHLKAMVERNYVVKKGDGFVVKKG